MCSRLRYESKIIKVLEKRIGEYLYALNWRKDFLNKLLKVQIQVDKLMDKVTSKLRVSIQ